MDKILIILVEERAGLFNKELNDYLKFKQLILGISDVFYELFEFKRYENQAISAYENRKYLLDDFDRYVFYEQVKIYDLAVNLIKLSGYEPHKDIEIKITGLRPGEKLYEERLMEEEGLTKTANDRISIGKPLEIDDEKLFATLDKLYDEAYSESEKMKDLVKELVPTYKIDRR